MASGPPAPPADGPSGTWLKRWEPEDPQFWKETGSKRAWLTLVVTTSSLVFSFATWFTISAVVVLLPRIGFTFTTMELFWIAAMPGISGGALRIVHSFLIPMFGSRHVITAATWLKILPMAWLAVAVLNPGTPFWVFLVIGFLCGMGGGDFSSYMPSTSLFFPKRLQGLALGLQAGIGNFGVSLAQFMTPWLVTFPLFGFLGAYGAPQVFRKGEVVKEVWVQNAALWYIPLLAALGFLCWFLLRSVPVRASFKEQLDIFKSKHTWFCTVTYVMTFGTFSGFSASFPLMIATLYGKFPGAPDPLAYAFLGPLIGSVIRATMGAPSDKWGGSIFTQFSSIGLIGGCLVLVFGGLLAPSSMDQFPFFVATMLWIFLMAGVGNAATFRQYPIVFALSPRQGAQVLGWTGAVAAFGPFLFSSLIGASITGYGSPVPFFLGITVFYFIGGAINWWYYTRPGAERGDWGAKWGTWYEKEEAREGGR